MNRLKFLLIVVMVLVVTALHYLTAPWEQPWHVIFRELYLIPIVLAGLWSGRAWGLTCSVSVSLIYLPHVFGLALYQTSVHHMAPVGTSIGGWIGNALQILVFNLAGFLAGAYGDTKAGFVRRTSTPYRTTEYGRKFLLCVDQTSSGLYAAKYFSDVMALLPGIEVTLLWVAPVESEDFAATSAESTAQYASLTGQGETALNRAREILLSGGLPPEAIKVKTQAAVKGQRLSEVIMAEIESNGYDTVVVGKHNTTKTQEFLFGSVAISLVRHSGTGVLVVRIPDDGGEIENENKAGGDSTD